MEIRNALKKIDNYLSVVQNLNKTILEEGTMAPDELKLMKKYLRGCIDRVEEIELMLNIEVEQPEVKPVVMEKQEPVTEPALQNNLTPEALLEEEIKPELPEEVKIEEFVSVETVNIIIDPEQVRDEVVSEPEKENTELPVTETTETIDEQTQLIVEEIVMETNIQQTTFQLVGTEEEEGEQIVGKEEKRTWADHWKDQSEPVNNGLVNNEEETVIVEMMEAPAIAVLERMEVTTEEEIKLPLVASWEEEEEEVVETIVAFKEETTVNDVIQANKETGLFETFNSIQETVPLKPYIMETQTKETHESDVLIAELDNKQPEFSVSTIFDQVKTGSEERIKAAKTLSESIALNDKFIFVRELFGNQFNEYESALRLLDAMNSFADAENYCMQNLHGKFKWTDRPANAEKFFALLEKRFTIG